MVLEKDVRTNEEILYVHQDIVVMEEQFDVIHFRLYNAAVKRICFVFLI